jgi:hypothetical protein
MGETETRFSSRYGPTALVAGASEGMGAAWARALAGRGLNLVLLARRETELRELAAELSRDHRIEARAVRLDLADPALLERLREAVKGLEIGLLVYNAAHSTISPFTETSLDQHLKSLDVNCRGLLVLVHELLPSMVSRGGGGMILMSSMAGFQGSAWMATYAASKAFDTTLAEGLWQELRPHGVDVMACIAGATSSPNFLRSKPKLRSSSFPPVMTPEQVVDEALVAFGKGPSHIAGFGNRLAAWLTRYLMSRRRVVGIMSRTTQGMYLR